MTLFRVLFVFLALCAVLDCQLVCEEMRLEHTECHTVNRGPIVQNPDYPQEVIWVEALQEQISDIRMIPADCRRGLAGISTSYFCLSRLLLWALEVSYLLLIILHCRSRLVHLQQCFPSMW